MKAFAVILLNLVSISLTAGASPSEPTSSTGEVVTYEILAAARCICDASLLVGGSDGRKGFVLDTQKVSSIKIRVQGKSLVLNDPPEGIRFYYAGLESNAWVKAELAKQGIELGENDSIVLISFTGSVVLFENANAKKPVRN